MPWRRLTDWFSGRRSGLPGTDMPLTLVTLSAMEHAERDEVAFYSDAEYAALIDWARMGRFILALSAVERDELTLLCVQSPDEMLMQVENLPLVSAGLATFDIRRVMPLRLTNPESERLQ